MRNRIMQNRLASVIPERRDRLNIARSLSGQYWCVALNGDLNNPVYQDECRWRCERELRRLKRVNI